MTVKRFLNFFRSPYFHIGNMFILCLFGATLTTLFPFHDLSLSYIFRWKIVSIWGVSFLMSICCMAVVSITWYWFQQSNDDSEDSLWAIARYALYGGILPMSLVITEICLVQGVDMLLHHNMQYHLWLYAVLLFALNMYYRSVGLRSRMHDQQLSLAHWQSEYDIWQSALQTKDACIDDLKESIKQKEKQIVLLENELSRLKQQSSEWTDLYTIKINGSIQVFRKRDIGGFLINDKLRANGGKPIIDMYLLSGESLIDNSASLKSLLPIFPSFRMLTRQMLISPDSITGYVEGKREVALQVKFLKEPYILNSYGWDRNKDWIQQILDK